MLSFFLLLFIFGWMIPRDLLFRYSVTSKYTYKDLKGFGYLISSKRMAFIFEFENEIIDLNIYEK